MQPAKNERVGNFLLFFFERNMSCAHFVYVRRARMILKQTAAIPMGWIWRIIAVVVVCDAWQHKFSRTRYIATYSLRIELQYTTHLFLCVCVFDCDEPAMRRCILAHEYRKLWNNATEEERTLKEVDLLLSLQCVAAAAVASFMSPYTHTINI